MYKHNSALSTSIHQRANFPHFPWLDPSELVMRSLRKLRSVGHPEMIKGEKWGLRAWQDEWGQWVYICAVGVEVGGFPCSHSLLSFGRTSTLERKEILYSGCADLARFARFSALTSYLLCFLNQVWKSAEKFILILKACLLL